MNLNEAKLQQRSKELDAREEYLDAKLKTLDEAPITLKVYEARFKAFEDKLDSIQLQIKNAKQELEEITRIYSVQYNNYQEIQETIKKNKLLVNDLKKEAQESRRNISLAKTELKSLERYLKEQQELIDQSIAQGNKRLLALQDEASSIEHEIIEFKGARTSLERDIDDIALIKIQDEQKLYDALNSLSNQKTNLEHEIDELINRITKKSAEYKRVEAQTSEKLNKLKEKEESIIAKRDALRLERQELEEDKRRFTSTKSLYED